MRKITTRGAGLVLAPLFLSLASCVPGNQILSDVSRLQREVADLRSFQAEQTTQISSMQSDLRTLAGRVEEMEYSQTRKAPVANEVSKPELPELSRRVPPPPIVPAAQLEEDENLASTLEGDAGRFLLLGFAKLRDGAFSEALAFFQEALASSYNTEWYPNVLFWVAVANDGLGDNKNAVRSYHEIVTNHAKFPRVPLTLLREASVFIRLADSPTAKLTLQKLIAQFPKSPEAAQAKEKLKDLR